ncbi:MAG: hypothetical protein PHI38_07845 [Sulfurimonas sp.]|uniref:hypothetical protein n=1 Tax=Sulfurimonas sp. TaxID=2022749 RepID=UPI00261989A8|nr:hypothetical protein [Sulfurimonas sp.]MDD3476766.1 hypothetical protein [Sulfurimonas sp.]
MNNNLADFLKIIYNEDDNSRGLATSSAGIISLVSYIKLNDIVITFLILVIFYPISRLIFIWIIKKYDQNEENKKITKFFQTFSIQEEILIIKFVRNGSSFLDLSYKEAFHSEFETLKNRNILKEVEYGYQLNIEIFNKAREIFKDECIPF